MAMTEEQNESIRAFAATNPTPEALAAAQQQYGVSDADYANALATAPDPYAAWNSYWGISPESTVTEQYQPAAQAAQVEFPAVIIGGGGVPASAPVMTEAQNESIRAFAATNPSDADLASAKATYGVSDSDYTNALAGGNKGITETYGSSTPLTYDPITMEMTDAQNASIRAYAATNPTAEALAAAKLQYGVSDTDYENAIATTPNPYAAWNAYWGTNLDSTGINQGPTAAQVAAAQAAQAEAPTVIIGGGGTPVSQQTPQVDYAALQAQQEAQQAALREQLAKNININYTAAGPLTEVQGVSTGTAGNYQRPSPFEQSAAHKFNTPTFDALRLGQQQRMIPSAPSFNFQSKPAFKDGGSVGALSRVIKHGI